MPEPNRRGRPTRRQRTSPSSWLLCATLLVSATGTLASVGDKSPAYTRCTAACGKSRCGPATLTAQSQFLPPHLDAYPKSSLLWSCRDTCRYACQQYLVDLALSYPLAKDEHDPQQAAVLEGLPLGEQVQFHGKWPFHRLDLSGLPWFPFGPVRVVDYLLVPRLQEPLSVVFSLANLWAHRRGLEALQKLAKQGRMVEGRRLARVYAAYAWSGILAWIASSVFHSRDVDWTERGDYFAAAGTMLVGLWAGVVRVQGWYAPLSKGKSLAPTQRRAASLWTLLLAGVFAVHCAYLGLRDRFDYTYNMQFNVAVALLTIALWGAWSYRQSRLPTPSNFSRRQLSSYPSARARFRAPHYLSPLGPLIALPLLTSLELLDFAPVGFGTGLRLLDAHALWHLSTVPVVIVWYRFLIKDVRWIDGQGEGGDPNSVLPTAPPGSTPSSTSDGGPNTTGSSSGATTTTTTSSGGGGGAGGSWVVDRLEREGRKLGFALGGTGGATTVTPSASAAASSAVGPHSGAHTRKDSGATTSTGTEPTADVKGPVDRRNE